MTIKDCMVCSAAIEVENDRDFIFSMADEANGPYCKLCWMEKQAIGADTIMDALFSKKSQELQ